MKQKTRWILLLGMWMGIHGLYGQTPNFQTKHIENLLATDSLTAAKNQIQKAIAYYQSVKNYDSLVRYIPLAASLKLNQQQQNLSIAQAQQLTEYIVRNGNHHVAKKALQELAWLHSNYGNSQMAYELLVRALAFAEKMNQPQVAEIHDIEYSLGYNASGMGNFQLAKKHYNKALRLQNQYDAQDYVSFQIIYNALGGIMWYESQLDSSAYYFEKSVEVLAKTDNTDLLNQYYRPALVKMNLSILMNAQGKNYRAISYVQEAIQGYERFIQQSSDEGRVFQAKKHQLIAIENLASFYNTIGEHQKTQYLIEYAYQKKQRLFDKDNINLVISQILLSEAKMANLDGQGAWDLIQQAVAILEKNPQQSLYWYAAALATKGQAAELLHQTDTAFTYYQKAESVYRQVMKGQYTKDHMDQLLEFSLFYAKNNYSDKALPLATEIYQLTKKNDFKNTLQDLYHTINLAEVYYLLKDYPQAIYYSQEALRFQPDSLHATTDSILWVYRKPKALLINSQAQYRAAPQLSQPLLENLLQQMEEGISILDQRRQSVVNHQDVTLLLAENAQLFDFAKKIQWELYRLTQNQRYLDDLLTLHESSIYYRIRSRLHLRETDSSAIIPQNILQREQTLKSKITQSLHTEKGNLKPFFEAQQLWKQFLDSLQQDYPKYYKMKYASVVTQLEGIQQNIEPQTTLIRYLFIDEQLFVVVLTNSHKQIIALDYPPIKNHINEIPKHSFDAITTGQLLYELYQHLWLPLESYLHTEKLIIIPDGELFNLSFEILTPTPIQNFDQLATHSLLSQYVISYNYSLLMVNPKSWDKSYTTNYIAFAPVFNTEMKEQYLCNMADSTAIDESYLTLLPQPFSKQLVINYAQLFDGTYFIHDQAVKNLFVQQANQHKIIHIATHAESNNISPELSRLIFAKNNSFNPLEDNSLYTYEIYNIPLTSNLTILTACETGKPTHQPGEGMISLAHAFNFAGSKSILTSLWEIDEESSSTLVDYFYSNLKKGMDKDRALQQAKLTYLTNHQGRTVAPEYWAGLVLIGDTTAIAFNSSNTFPSLLLGIVLLLVCIIIFYYFFKKRRSQ